MLKIQEITIDGDVFRLREPRVADYRAAKGKDNEDFMIAMMAGMLLDEEGRPLGEEGVMNLPLRALAGLTSAVEQIVNGKVDPLEKTDGSSTA